MHAKGCKLLRRDHLTKNSFDNSFGALVCPRFNWAAAPSSVFPVSWLLDEVPFIAVKQSDERADTMAKSKVGRADGRRESCNNI